MEFNSKQLTILPKVWIERDDKEEYDKQMAALYEKIQNEPIKVEVREPAEPGNYKWWFGTWNNPPEDWKKVLDDFAADYCIGQLEKGEQGTRHIQFLLHFTSAKRPSAWRGFKCWIKGISAADARKRVAYYVSKKETRLEGPYQYGVQPSAGRKEKMAAKEAIALAKAGRWAEIEEECLLRHVNNLPKVLMYDDTKSYLEEPCGIWIFGQPGYGKTHSVLLENESVYHKDPNLWWDGYIGQKVVLLDDLDKSHANLGYHLKIWADKWRHQGQIKGGYVRLKYTTFYVCSNYEPSDIFGGDETLLRAISRRFKFRLYYGFKQFVDGCDYGVMPKPPADNYIYE